MSALDDLIARDSALNQPSSLDAIIARDSAEQATNPAGLSRLDRYLKGVRDPIDAGAQMLIHALPAGTVNAGNRLNNWLAEKTGLVGKLPEGGIDQQISDNEKAYQAQRGDSGFDAYRALGNVVNPANIALGSAGGALAPASLAGRIGAGAATGAAGNLMNPVSEGEFAEEKLKQAGVGGGIGAALPVVGAGVSRAISPQVSESVQQLLKDKITPTTGQILGGGFQRLEDKLTSVPFLGDAIKSARNASLDEFNRAAYARALDPIKGTVPKEVGRDALASVREQLGKAYDDLLPKLTFKPDAQFNQELSSLQGMAQNLAPQEARRFQSLLSEHMSKMSPNGGMTGETFKIMEGALNKDAARFSKSLDPYQQELGAALKQTLQVFRDGMERSNPQYANELSNINKGYANYTRLRDAASRQGTEEGKFTPSQLAAAVRAQDKTVGKRAYSEGTALMQDLTDAGKSSLSPQYPDSGTAGRMLAALLGGGALATGAVNPLSMGVAALSAAPYLPGGRQIAAALLSRRPEAAKPISEAVRKYAPAITPGVAPLVNSRD